MPDTLYTNGDDIKNPLYDGRATAGLRTLKEFPAHMRFVEVRNFRTDKLLGLSLLWDTTVHMISLRDEDTRAQAACDALMADAIEVDPTSLDTCMMLIDPHWSGMGCSPSPADAVLDKLIRNQTLSIETVMPMLIAADAEGRR